MMKKYSSNTLNFPIKQFLKDVETSTPNRSIRRSLHEFLLNAHAEFPVMFFNFSFYLAFCPFRLRKSEDGLYDIDKTVIQQVLCSFVTITSLLHRFTETRIEWPKPEGTPVAYFALFFNLANLFFNLMLWYILWFKSGKILHLVRFLHLKESIPNSKLRVRATMGGCLIYVSSTIISLVCFIFGTDILNKSHWNPKLLFKCFANHAKYMIFITTDKGRVSESGELSQAELFMAVLYGFSHFFRRIVGLYENMLTAVGPFTLWIAAKEFIASLSPDENSPEIWHTVYQRYDDLRQLTDVVNEAFGPLFISHFITAFFFYSCNLDKFVTAADMFVRLKFFAYYFIFILTLLLASDICRQSKYMRKIALQMSLLEPWIAKNIKEKALSDLNQKELTLILHELEVNRISITGCGSFSMTYSVSAQVAGAIMTYFIISLQYRTL